MNGLDKSSVILVRAAARARKHPTTVAGQCPNLEVAIVAETLGVSNRTACLVLLCMRPDTPTAAVQIEKRHGLKPGSIYELFRLNGEYAPLG